MYERKDGQDDGEVIWMVGGFTGQDIDDVPLDEYPESGEVVKIESDAGEPFSVEEVKLGAGIEEDEPDDFVETGSLLQNYRE